MSLKDQTIKLHSWDVFDTVLTRAVADPSDVFFFLGREAKSRGLIAVSGIDFLKARKDAELLARAKKTSGETRIEGIYFELKIILKLNDVDSKSLQDLELEWERKMIHPIPISVDELKSLRLGGEKICFISDTYFRQDFVVSQLQRFNILAEGEKVYVSSEYDCSKSNGGLFRKMLESENVKSNEVIHHGNDKFSDIQQPKSLGLRTQGFLEGNLNRYEQILSRYVYETKGTSSLLAGACRLTRLNKRTKNQCESTLREVAACVIAPVLIAYVAWVLKRAREFKLKDLYFLSRDGQILLKIAKKLSGKFKYDFNLEYLYGGRQAWFLPLLERIDAKTFDWVLECGDRFTLKSVLTRVGLEYGDIADVLNKEGFSKKDYDEVLNKKELIRFEKVVLSDWFLDKVLTKNQTRKKMFLGYLQQNGLPQKKAWGIIDVGWRGRLQDCLTKISNENGFVLPIGFYLGHVATAEQSDAFSKYAYLLDSRTPDIISSEWSSSMMTLLEVFTSADHGSVVGYDLSGDTFRPILKESSPELRQLDKILVIHQTVLEVLDQFILNGEFVDWEQNIRRAIFDVFMKFTKDPSVLEAETIGGFQFSSDQNGLYGSKIAEKIPIRRILKTYLENRPMEFPHPTAWGEACAKLTNPYGKLLIKILKSIKKRETMRKKMRNLQMKLSRRMRKRRF